MSRNVELCIFSTRIIEWWTRSFECVNVIPAAQHLPRDLVRPSNGFSNQFRKGEERNTSCVFFVILLSSRSVMVETSCCFDLAPGSFHHFIVSFVHPSPAKHLKRIAYIFVFISLDRAAVHSCVGGHVLWTLRSCVMLATFSKIPTFSISARCRCRWLQAPSTAQDICG